MKYCNKCSEEFGFDVLHILMLRSYGMYDHCEHLSGVCIMRFTLSIVLMILLTQVCCDEYSNWIMKGQGMSVRCE